MSLRHAVLGLVNERPASGYELMHSFNTSLVSVWPANQSQVYGELTKLAEAGLLSVSAEGPRGRKEYTITEAGRAELVHWLADTEPNRVRRSEALLRVFFLGNLTNAQAIDYMRQEGEIMDARLEGLRTMANTGDWDADGLAIYGRLVLEYGLRLMVMHNEWTEWAIAQLKARQSSAAEG